MTELQYRAQFSADVRFSNGGGLQARDFRVDVPGPQVSEHDVAALFIASLGLLMVESVQISGLTVLTEAHKGTRGGPSEVHRAGQQTPTSWELVELSHLIRADMITYPGLPGPEVTPHLTRVESREHYAPGVEFAIDRVSMVGNTGTYLDSPYHRYADGTDLAGLPLTAVAELPAVVVRTLGSRTRAVDVGALAATEVTGCAVLLHTGGDRNWGRPAYADDAPYLTEAGARWLVDHDAKLVGIDSMNIDDTTSGGYRPAHSALLAAGIPIVEHLTGLEQMPLTGARFTAAPPLFAGFGTFPVRAYAAIPRAR